MQTRHPPKSRVSRTRRLLGAAGCALLAAAFPPGAAQAQTVAPSVDRAYPHLEMLAGRIGERAAGTEGEALAVAYIRKQFDGWKLQTTLVPIRVPVWHEVRTRLWVEGKPMQDLHAKSVVFSGITPPEGIVGEFVDLGPARDSDLAGKDLKGKIALIQRDAYMEYPDVALTDRLAPYGLAGLIFYASPGRKGLPTIYYNFKRALNEPTPPAVVISNEDAMQLARLAPAKLGLTVRADVAWKESHSVIGELTGATKPDEIVVIAAHNDSAYTSPAATDDGGGVAVVMELARAFAEGPRPQRTIRFITWGGHELGLAGSEAYLKAYPADIDRTIAYINYDIIGGPLGELSWGSAGDPAFEGFVEKTARSIGLRGFGGTGVTNTEATVFGALEVPSVSLVAGGANENHTPWDDIGLTSAKGLDEPLRMGAALLSRLANDTRLRFPHKFPASIIDPVREDAAKYAWGIRPEANRPPRR